MNVALLNISKESIFQKNFFICFQEEYYTGNADDDDDVRRAVKDLLMVVKYV